MKKYFRVLQILVVTLMFRKVLGLRIIWDKNMEEIDYNSIDMGRAEETRLPNWFFIYPGTKWCGVGNIADDDNDLGQFASTDKCCRNHDKCNDFIDGFGSKYNLTNYRFYTKLNCSCDDEFFKCLKSVNTRVSKSIGNIYFNALGTECFRFEHPIEKCVKHMFAPWKKCVIYKLKLDEEKLYQWFDVPIF